MAKNIFITVLVMLLLSGLAYSYQLRAAAIDLQIENDKLKAQKIV